MTASCKHDWAINNHWDGGTAPYPIIQCIRCNETSAGAAPLDDMCPNCVTPWKCNGPHIYGRSARADHVWVGDHGVAAGGNVPPPPVRSAGGASPLESECDCDCHLCDCYLRHSEGTDR